MFPHGSRLADQLCLLLPAAFQPAPSPLEATGRDPQWARCPVWFAGQDAGHLGKGLRLSEALQLSWDRYEKLRIDFQSGQPVLRTPAELEKGHQDRLLPITPEFVEFLLRTPSEERNGWVFNPRAQRVCGERMRLDSVSKVISDVGEKAKIVVHADARTKKVKYASAHDFRRAFRDWWALRVMPPVLMQLMRHESKVVRFHKRRCPRPLGGGDADNGLAFPAGDLNQVPSPDGGGSRQVDAVDFANFALRSAPELVRQAICLTFYRGLLLTEAAGRLKVSRFLLMRRLQAFYDQMQQAG